VTRWVDQPDWSDEVARRLHTALQEAYYRIEDLQQVWIEAGMNPADVVWTDSASNLWRALARDAHAAGGDRLEAMIISVRTRKPALASRLDAILEAEIESDTWYSTTDHFAARLLGPGSHQALVNRGRLVRGLRRVALDSYPVFNIRGRPGSGKSHSRLLMAHVCSSPALKGRMVIVDVAYEWPDGPGAGAVSALDFVRVLAQKFGMDAGFTVDVNTHADRISRDLANVFVARYAGVRNPADWIFIDGLDRPGILPEVHTLVSHLALAAEGGELLKTRLIVTGHPGDFASRVLDVLVEEEIDQIDEADVASFFTEIGKHVGKHVDPTEAKALAQKVLVKAPLGDLRALGRAASDEAHRRFGAG
jgi:hypothetical protein